MLDLAAFQVRFPEFALTDVGAISAALADAATRTGDVWGTKEDAAHGLLTAHILALSALGQQSRLESDKSETTYGKELRRMRLALVGARPDLRCP